MHSVLVNSDQTAVAVRFADGHNVRCTCLDWKFGNCDVVVDSCSKC